jgi:hypothetical protein
MVPRTDAMKPASVRPQKIATEKLVDGWMGSRLPERKGIGRSTGHRKLRAATQWPNNVPGLSLCHLGLWQLRPLAATRLMIGLR